MSACNGHHWSKFWWQDWAGDAALRACSLAAQGLWMRLLCVMHEATPRGYLLLDGQPPTAKQLASITGATLKELANLLGELKAARVYSIDPEGWIFSRRMVKDTQASEKGRETGKRGGNPELLRKANGKGSGDHTHPPEGVNPPSAKPLNPNPYPKPLTATLNRQETEPESQAEPVREKRKELSSGSSLETAARAGQNPPLDGLDAVLAEAGVAQPKPGIVGAEVVQMHVRRTAKAMEMRVPYATVRSKNEQVDAALDQLPPVVEGADYHWGPVDPIRTPAEQYAAIMGCPLAEAEARLAIPPWATADA